jgi:hypothetical protein
METKGRRKNLRLSSRADLQRKPWRADGADYGFSNESNAEGKCPDINDNLGSYLAKKGA